MVGPIISKLTGRLSAKAAREARKAAREADEFLFHPDIGGTETPKSTTKRKKPTTKRKKPTTKRKKAPTTTTTPKRKTPRTPTEIEPTPTETITTAQQNKAVADYLASVGETPPTETTTTPKPKKPTTTTKRKKPKTPTETEPTPTEKPEVSLSDKPPTKKVTRAATQLEKDLAAFSDQSYSVIKNLSPRALHDLTAAYNKAGGKKPKPFQKGTPGVKPHRGEVGATPNEKALAEWSGTTAGRRAILAMGWTRARLTFSDVKKLSSKKKKELQEAHRAYREESKEIAKTTTAQRKAKRKETGPSSPEEKAERAALKRSHQKDWEDRLLYEVKGSTAERPTSPGRRRMTYTPAGEELLKKGDDASARRILRNPNLYLRHGFDAPFMPKGTDIVKKENPELWDDLHNNDPWQLVDQIASSTTPIATQQQARKFMGNAAASLKRSKKTRLFTTRKEDWDPTQSPEDPEFIQKEGYEQGLPSLARTSKRIKREALAKAPSKVKEAARALPWDNETKVDLTKSLSSKPQFTERSVRKVLNQLDDYPISVRKAWVKSARESDMLPPIPIMGARPKINQPDNTKVSTRKIKIGRKTYTVAQYNTTKDTPRDPLARPKKAATQKRNKEIKAVNKRIQSYINKKKKKKTWPGQKAEIKKLNADIVRLGLTRKRRVKVGETILAPSVEKERTRIKAQLKKVEESKKISGRGAAKAKALLEEDLANVEEKALPPSAGFGTDRPSELKKSGGRIGKKQGGKIKYYKKGGRLSKVSKKPRGVKIALRGWGRAMGRG